jgi:uncharacterized protein
MPKASQHVEIKEHGPKISKPSVIVGVPEVGLVGTIACSFLVEQLKFESRGYIDSEFMPQVMVVHNSTPTYPIHLFGKDGIMAIVSEVPLTPRLSLALAREVSEWARAREAKVVVGVSGIPSRKREESQGEGKPAVMGISNNSEMLKTLKPLGALPLEEGIITGFYASLIKYCTLAGQANVTLLGESLLQFPDPASAASVIEVLNGMLSVKVDTQILLKESEDVRIRTRELMQQTQQTHQNAQEPGRSPTVYR